MKTINERIRDAVWKKVRIRITPRRSRRGYIVYWPSRDGTVGDWRPTKEEALSHLLLRAKNFPLQEFLIEVPSKHYGTRNIKQTDPSAGPCRA